MASGERETIYAQASNEKLAEMLRWNYSTLPPSHLLAVMAEALARLLTVEEATSGER